MKYIFLLLFSFDCYGALPQISKNSFELRFSVKNKKVESLDAVELDLSLIKKRFMDDRLVVFGHVSLSKKEEDQKLGISAYYRIADVFGNKIYAGGSLRASPHSLKDLIKTFNNYLTLYSELLYGDFAFLPYTTVALKQKNIASAGLLVYFKDAVHVGVHKKKNSTTFILGITLDTDIISSIAEKVAPKQKPKVGGTKPKKIADPFKPLSF